MAAPLLRVTVASSTPNTLRNTFRDFSVNNSPLGRHAPKQVDVFLRRALWEGAIVAYGRCFNTGNRQQLTRDLFDGLDPADVALHERFDQWRDTYVAHRVDRSRESVDAAIVLTKVAGIGRCLTPRWRIRRAGRWVARAGSYARDCHMQIVRALRWSDCKTSCYG